MSVSGKVVGGWTNPFELNSRHLGWFPQVLMKIQKLFETIISALVEFIVIFVTHVFVFSSKKKCILLWDEGATKKDFDWKLHLVPIVPNYAKKKMNMSPTNSPPPKKKRCDYLISRLTGIFSEPLLQKHSPTKQSHVKMPGKKWGNDPSLTVIKVGSFRWHV